MPTSLPFPASNRRRFLTGTGSAFAALVASGCSTSPRAASALSVAGYGPLQADPAGYMDLPRGFSYRVISALGDAMDDGATVPDKADGMGCFNLGGGKIALVRNHELITTDDAGGTIAAGFDRREGKVLPGGTTNLVLDAKTLEIERQFRSLGGTIRNCSGGVTPWGTWLTCEEAPVRPGERYGDGIGQDHGWVFEVPADASALVNPEPLKAMGRFNHEAAAVDPATGIVYLTEDRGDSLLYRFIPAVRGKLSEGGKLQALKLTDGTRDSRNWDGATMPLARKYEADWVDITDVESPGDDLRQQGAEKGGLLIARGEGIHLGDGEFYFCATNGGAAKLGQVFRLVPGRNGAADTLELFFESTSPDQFNYGDNLTVGPNGHLVVCEDQYTDVVTNHLRGISPQGQAYPIALLREQTELAGEGSYVFGYASVALGADSYIASEANHSVALGAGAVATEAYTVSVGSAEQRRRITNVAAGVSASDAATVGQLENAILSLNGGIGAALGDAAAANQKATENSAAIAQNTSAISLNTASIARNSDDIAALQSSFADTQSELTYFASSGSLSASVSGSDAVALGSGASSTASATSIGARSAAVGSGGSSLGFSAESGVRSTAIGFDATALSESSVAIGDRSITSGNSGTAIGASSSAAGVAVAIGRLSSAANSGAAIGFSAEAGSRGTAIGYDATASGTSSLALGERATGSGTQSLALGGSASATQTNSTAIGTRAQAVHAGSTALGVDAATTATNQVTLGGTGSSVRIGDIAASTAAQSGSVQAVTVDAAGTLGTTAIATAAQVDNVRLAMDNIAAVTDAQFAALSDQVTGLDFRLDQLDEGLSGGIASAMALGSAAIVPDKNVSLTVSAATYAGEQAFAGQFSGRVSDSVYVSAGVTGNTGDKKVGARVAATVGF